MALGGPRQRTVLARLLLDPGRVVPSDVLIDDVWNACPPATAGKTLQKYVSELRRALGNGVLQTRGGGYAIEGGRLDARRFEDLAAQAHAAQAAGDVRRALRLAGEAQALWRGDVLADLPEARFADGERARLDELRLAVLEARYAAELALGHHALAAAGLAELVEAHPLREALWALLLRALYGAGRQADALRAFERHRRHLAEELGIDPSPELRHLETAILRQELDAPAAPPVAGDGNLPPALSSFVGRRDLSAALDAVLAAHRLVTLTGPGGVGKTRLALEAARRAEGDAWFVDLSSAVDGRHVVRTLADALEVGEQPGQGLDETVVAVLAHRRPTLLVLDNCEHVARPCAEMARSILRRCPPVRLLATSRVPLEIEGECIRSVAPLDDEEAVALFVDRARLTAGEFSLTAEERPVVEDVCRRLDGLPLAIELAASQVRVLHPAQLAARLDDRFRLLSSRSGSPRQRTLLATVEWGYELLTPEARKVFDRLGVIPGSFPLEAAEALWGGDVLPLLTELVDHSLVTRRPGRATAARYGLLDTLRLFARERLDAGGGAADANRAYASFLLRLAETAAPHFYGPAEVTWRAILHAEDHGLRAALDWTSAHDPALAHRLAIALWPYWDVGWQERYAIGVLRPLLTDASPEVADDLRAWALTVAAELAANAGDGREAMTWADEAVDRFARLDDERGLVCAQLALGSALGNQGTLDRAAEVLRAALEGCRQLGDERLQARARQLLGFVAVRRGDLGLATSHHREELGLWERAGSVRGRATALRRLAAIERDRRDLRAAEGLCREALACMEQLDDAAGIAHVRLTLADLARLRGDGAAAAALYQLGLEEVRAIGDRRCMASTFKNLATMADAAGDGDRAPALYLDSMALRRELGDDAGLAECLDGLAVIAHAQGRYGEAATVLAAAQARRDASGALPPPDEAEAIAALAGSLRDRMDADAFASATAKGSSFGPDEAFTYCRTRFAQPSRVAGHVPQHHAPAGP